MPDWEELDEFFSPDEFSTEGVINHQSGEQISVLGLFDEKPFDAELGEYDMDTSTPRFLCKAADVSNVSNRDTITINTVSYDILKLPEFDGTGLATLTLAKAS